MKIKNLLIILSIVSLLVLNACTPKQAEEKIYPANEEKDYVIISLSDLAGFSQVEQKYEIYNSGKYIKTLINKNKQETKNEGQLQESDLNYLKSLVQSKEFNSIPPYMEGAGSDCSSLFLKINLNNEEKTIRAESCANTPEAFNNVITAIQKLK